MAALETVIEDAEAELAKVKRNKVASMVKMYQGAPQLLALGKSSDHINICTV
jgi:hypothetical protein